MAKEDFCFTYYDGDATRDTSHMNRLERGCYHDLIISIRKFGHLTIEQCKRLLKEDFETCWPSIEIILKIDAEGKYFIEWLENSLVKSKKHSEKQRNNRIGKTKQEPNNNQNTILVEPLGDGYEYGYENENFGKSENLLQVDHDSGLWQGEKNSFLNDFRWKEKFCRDKAVEQLDLEKWMNEFLADLELKEQVKPLKELKNHFTNWFNKNKKNAQRAGENNRKLGTSQARTEALGRWKIPEGTIRR